MKKTSLFAASFLSLTTLLSYAADNRQIPLCAPYAIRSKGLIDDHILFEAVKSGDHLAVETCLAQGAYVYAKDANGEEPIHHASTPSMVQTLRAYRANLEAKNRYGVTALFQAFEDGEFSLAEELLAQGADINTQDSADCTPLHTAVLQADQGSGENLKFIRLAIAYNADLEVQDEGGDTPLNIAAQFRYWPEVQLLLAAGASVHTTNDDGECPLDFLSVTHHTNQ